jgi:hypothetical protein
MFNKFANGRWYPTKIRAGEFAGAYNNITIDFLTSNRNILSSMQKDQFQIAELGIWKGGTSYQFAKFLDGQGILHLFDFEDKVIEVRNNLNNKGFTNVKTWGCSYKYLDSYNWALMKILKEADKPIFDYIYIDGAHTWTIDALAYFLCDKLLKPGGYIDFDDYCWKLRGSSLDPQKVHLTKKLFTDEQIDERQVKLIVDILVRRNSNYKEVIPNKIFQKI